MSKASEWAHGFSARPQARFDGVLFEVSNDGDMNVCASGTGAKTLIPAEAIKLASWILEHFEEATP